MPCKPLLTIVNLVCLKNHVLVVHENKGPHKCTKCGKSWESSAHLTKHIRTHTKEKTFKCSWTGCIRKYSQIGDLTRHIDIVHKKVKKYKCSDCGKVFGLLQKLTRHRRIHTGEKPYKRNVCGRGFVNRSNMKRHTLVIHST